MGSRERTVASARIGALALVAACAKPGSEHTFLQAEDLAAGPGFSRNEIVDTAAFIDANAFDATTIDRFLTHTPYGRPSFLATYQSNGVRASDAIVRAAAAYRLNPIGFLVRAETEQGLLGEQFYPSPPARVEYAFGCGCDGRGHCDPALAGFDLQVDCLGRALRKSLDRIATAGATEGGWAPGVESRTVDGAKVTPNDESTAALYQYTPKLGLGSSGNWLFWNVWQLYANTLEYAGPSGPPPGGAFIGDACSSDTVCSYVGGICATNYPGGLCTASCTGDCPTAEGKPPAYCASFQQAGYCLAICNPSVAASCRTGYACKKVQRFGSTTDAQFVCVAN